MLCDRHGIIITHRAEGLYIIILCVLGAKLFNEACDSILNTQPLPTAAMLADIRGAYVLFGSPSKFKIINLI